MSDHDLHDIARAGNVVYQCHHQFAAGFSRVAALGGGLTALSAATNHDTTALVLGAASLSSLVTSLSYEFNGRRIRDNVGRFVDQYYNNPAQPSDR